MGAKAFQQQCFSVRLTVDQEQVRANMALPVTYPPAGQRMITVPFGKGLVRGQQASDSVEFSIQSITILPTFFTSIITSEGSGASNRPHRRHFY